MLAERPRRFAMPAGLRSIALLCLAAAILCLPVDSPAESPTPAAGSEGESSAETQPRYIVVLEDSVDHPGNVAKRHEENRDAELSQIYRTALKGYAARLSPDDVKAVRRDPAVAFVELDQRVEPASQTIPTGISRAYALGNEKLHIDEASGPGVDVDVAVIDTGVDASHPDLDVVEATSCVGIDPNYEDYGVPSYTSCVDVEGTDGAGHGTHVAGTIAAEDNDLGVVGVAPGARIWSVQVLSSSGPSYISEVIAGVDWVTSHADEIEVANMSLGCASIVSDPHCQDSTAMDLAIGASVDSGVVYTVAAHNFQINASQVTPANNPDVITVSALADFDGRSGGLASPTCQFDQDDTLANFSNYGSEIEVAAPGVCINSTVPVGSGPGGSSYNSFSGTSMATPHVAGAAAILASKDNPGNREDVMAIRQTIVDEGNFNWVDERDGVEEPLLDLSCEAIFDPRMVGEASSAPSGSVAASDVDCDGRSDLVTLRPNGLVTVFGGTDRHTFGPGVTSFSNGKGGGTLDPAQYDGSGHYVVDVADVDGIDGHAELVTLDDDGDVHAYPGQSNRTFGSGTTSSLNLTPALLEPGGHEPIAVADVDGNGRADLVSYDDVADKVMVYKGNLDRTFAAGIEGQGGVSSALFGGSGEYFVDVGDVTGDAKADLVSITSSGDLRVRPGTSSGTFATAVVSHKGGIEPAMADGKGHEPYGLGDVTGDGRADLGLHKDGKGLVFPGAASGAFGAPVGPPEGGAPPSTFGSPGFQLFGLMDVGGDGRADVLGSYTDGKVYVAEGQSSGQYGAGHESFNGEFFTTQHHQNQDAARHEVATEHPAWKRRGCSPMGCHPDGDSVGLWRQSENSFYLRHWSGVASTPGLPSFTAFQYGISGTPELDLPLAGDWNGDGADSIGVWRRGGQYAQFRLRDSNTAGAPDHQLVYGIDEAPADHLPVVGDWDGDGTDTASVWERQGTYARFILRNSNQEPTKAEWDEMVTWGIDEAPEYDLPVAGDWDGDGDDNIGVWRRSTNTWYLCYDHSNCGQHYYSFQFGNSEAPYNDLPVAGDWDGDGDDTIGVWRRQGAGAYFHLRNSNSAGAADYSFWWGADESPWLDLPVIGNWNERW